MRNRLHLHRAFTLVELLVVIAIIAVLISLLAPSLGLARGQAKQLICATHLRSHGQSAAAYATDNADWMLRGIGQYTGRPESESTTYAISILPGLAYDGATGTLWNPLQQDRLIEILAGIPQFQCPSHPREKQKLDYVTNAFPIPYTKSNIREDASGGGQQGARWRGEQPDHYVGFFRLSRISRFGTARFIYVTEGHRNLARRQLRFHHTFYTSQLPLGAFPRIANDLRHPGGINALFFDQHVATKRPENLDSGWPNTLGHRLRYFTVVPGGE